MVVAIRVALVAVVVLAIVALIGGASPPIWWILVPAGALLVARAFVTARLRNGFGQVPPEEPSTRQWVAPHTEPIDIGEELIDLLQSAMAPNTQMLEGQ